MKRLFFGYWASLISAAILILTWSNSASAQGLLITDCQGFKRAYKEADPGSLNKVEVEVNSPVAGPEGIEVTLTNSVTGSVVSAKAVGGKVVFENVSAGVFSISTTAPNAVLSTISIGAMGFTAAVATTAVVTTGIIGTSGVVLVGDQVVSQVADSGGGNNNDDDDNDGSNGGPTPTPTPIEPPMPTPTPTPIPSPIPTPTPCDCDPDATPPPLNDENDFFAAREAQPLSPSS